MQEISSNWQTKLTLSTRRPALAGYFLIAVMTGTFGFWGATAPMAGAVIAPGAIVAAGRNVEVQHPDGGIIRSIAVHDGDTVRRGDTLLVLDDTAARTQLNRLDKQWMSLLARIARLKIERDGGELFDPSVTASPLPAGQAEMFQEEVVEFNVRLARFRSESLILDARLEQLSDSGDGLGKQEASISRQAALVGDEISRKHDLLDRGLINRSDYTDLLRIEADLSGQLAQVSAARAANRSQIAETREQREGLRTQRVEDAVTKLNEANGSIRDVEEQLDAARQVLERTVVKAPVDGIVVSSVYNALGNVLAPREKVMEILPTAEQSRVEARVKPGDIDAVRSGQTVKLRLPALNARLTPELTAVVELLSADRLTDPASHEPYYRAVLRIEDRLPVGLQPADLRPGMPVEAFIQTGERTFFSYLGRPLMDSMHRAFTEE